MEIRNATVEDGEAIQQIARQSMQASYSLQPHTISTAVEQWFGSTTMEEKINDDALIVFVVEHDETIIAFSESAIVGETGELLWLHVDPDYRTEGFGFDLFEHTINHLEANGARIIRGHVLAENPDGNSFYQDLGLTKAGEDTVKIDGTTYTENVYVRDGEAPLEAIETGDTKQLFIDQTDPERGSLGPIYPVFSDKHGNEKYGYFCDHCTNLIESMDTMGRLECTNCGNHSKPTRWDAAYL